MAVEFHPMVAPELADLCVAEMLGVTAVDLDDDDHGQALRHYLLFAQCAHVFDPPMDAQSRLYNAYYWLRRYSRLHAMKHGFDAGLEQQAFALLESAPCEIDWAVVEHIDERA